MEKYGQYRDKGSGIAPFFPAPRQQSSILLLPVHFSLFCIRLPFLLFFIFIWLVFTQFTSCGNILRKANLWCIIGVPGIWWVDLQVDGVRRGSLSSTPKGRLPGPGCVIAASHTSPIDVIYLAAIFDPVFTQSYPGTKLVRHVGLWEAVWNSFRLPLNPEMSQLSTVDALNKANPSRVIATFPETTTSNGRSILRLSTSLLSSDPKTKIYPVSLRYTPPDITTAMPGPASAATFMWRLLSRPTHCIRTRIGQSTTTSTAATILPAVPKNSPGKPGRESADKRKTYESNFFDTLKESPPQKVKGESEEEEEGGDERALDAVADALARLGRVKRVDLGIEEKAKFVNAWQKRRR